jgi:bacteriocin-like protein
MVSAPDKQGNDMTDLSNEVSELSIDELDAVSGGNLVDVAVQAVEAVARVVTNTVGKCTDHWYSN